MKQLTTLALVACMTVGCGTSAITVYKLVDDEPVPVVQVNQHFAGKGCIAVDSETDGSASVIVQQAGTSDWSISRALAFVGDIAGGVFGGERGANEMQSPSTGMEGCEGLFVDTADNETTEYPPPPGILTDPPMYRVIPVE